MGLRFWWLSLFVLIATLVFLLYGGRLKLKLKRKRQSKIEKRKPISHTRRLRSLPEYESILNKYGKVVLTSLILLGSAWLVMLVLVGRPSSSQVVYPEVRNRDIVLCFDVSGSMESAIVESLKTFSELVKGFEGQRIGMSFFNSSSVTILPLTNDYSLVSKILDDLATTINTDTIFNKSISAGTIEGPGVSLIGDGLASCIQRFDQLDRKRSRSVILVTDNYSGKGGLVNWDQAINLAKEVGVRIYGINPSDSSSEGRYYTYIPDSVKQFRQGTLDTNGDYYKLSDKLAIGSIIKKINNQDAALAQGSPQLLIVDHPQVWLLTGVVLLMGYIILAWRFRL